MVFIGDAGEVADRFGTELPNRLVELWPSGDPDVILLHRFETLVERTIRIYNSWLYHTWLMATIDTMQDLVWYKDKDGLHWLVNNKFENTVHKTRAMIHGMGHNYIWDVPPEDGGKSEFRCLESEREVMEKKTTCVSDEHVLTDKGLRHFLTYKSPLYGRDGDVMGTVGIGHDVTDLNNIGIEMKMLLENLPFSIAVVEDDWSPVEINSRFEREFGIHKDQASLSEFDYAAWKAETFSPVNERTYDEELHVYLQEAEVNTGNTREVFEIMEQEILDYFGNISGYYCLFRNVTIEREYESMILKFANTDSLTELYNRRYFFEYMQNHRHEPMTVLFMDMDNFKSVNDTYGHAAGDAVLKKTAEFIRTIYPEALAARLGGDEFAACIVGNTDLESVTERAGKLRTMIEEENAPLNLNVSISTGISMKDGRSGDIDAFINESDERMYKEKQKKKTS